MKNIYRVSVSFSIQGNGNKGKKWGVVRNILGLAFVAIVRVIWAWVRPHLLP
jgi:hypothetical protein